MIKLPDEIENGVRRDPQKYFAENPAMIFKEIALAAELGSDIETDTFNGMKTAAGALSALTAEEIRDGFAEILTAKSPARGLRLSVAAGIMSHVLGEECYPPKSKYEMGQFHTLMEQYDKVRPEIEYRYPMLFLCFDEKKAENAIKRLGFDEKRSFLYGLALKKTQELYFVVRPAEFKKFLYRNGWEHYEYWNNLVKQQRKVYDQPENRIMSRYYMLQEFEAYKMAVYMEDLAVSAADLRGLGIGEEKIHIILEKLLYMVHHKPRLNTKEKLLSEAKRYSRNPFIKYLRDIHFMR